MPTDDVYGMEAFENLSKADQENVVRVLESIGRGESAGSALDDLSDDATKLVIDIIAKKVLGL